MRVPGPGLGMLSPHDAGTVSWAAPGAHPSPRPPTLLLPAAASFTPMLFHLPAPPTSVPWLLLLQVWLGATVPPVVTQARVRTTGSSGRREQTLVSLPRPLHAQHSKWRPWCIGRGHTCCWASQGAAQHRAASPSCHPLSRAVRPRGSAGTSRPVLSGHQGTGKDEGALCQSPTVCQAFDMSFFESPLPEPARLMKWPNWGISRSQVYARWGAWAAQNQPTFLAQEWA